MGENSPNLVTLMDGWFPLKLGFNPKLVAHQPGVDVMIAIFGDFCQFSAKNWRFSQKPML
jgi:hypothetical protein